MSNPNEVKRYTQPVVETFIQGNEAPFGRAVRKVPLIPVPDGDWVKYSDYQVLEASKPTSAVQVVALNMKIDDLELENKLLREALEKVRQLMIDRGQNVYTKMIDEALLEGGKE